MSQSVAEQVSAFKEAHPGGTMSLDITLGDWPHGIATIVLTPPEVKPCYWYKLPVHGHMRVGGIRHFKV